MTQDKLLSFLCVFLCILNDITRIILCSNELEIILKRYNSLGKFRLYRPCSLLPKNVVGEKQPFVISLSTYQLSANNCDNISF